MSIQSENGFGFIASHSASGYTSGFTVSHDFFVIPGFLVVHVGLSRFQGTHDGPGGATIGVSELTFIDDDGAQVTRVHANPEDWEESVYRTMSAFTVSANVVRGTMRGWAIVQHWD